MLLKPLSFLVGVLAGLSILPSTAHAGWKLEKDREYEIGPSTVKTVTADFNRDGRPDVAALNAGNPNFEGDHAYIRVFLNKSKGDISEHLDYDLDTKPTDLFAADVNGDGSPDLLTFSRLESRDALMTTFFGKGDGSFGGKKTVSIKLDSGEIPGFGTVVDFNKDGFPDLAMAYENAFQVFLGDGEGGFRAFGEHLLLRGNYTPYPDPLGNDKKFSPNNIVSGDFNGDGLVDIATANGESLYCFPKGGCSGGRGTIDLLFGKGDGTFRLVTDDINAVKFIPTDLNGDGKTELISSTYRSYGEITDAELITLSFNSDGTYEIHHSPQFTLDEPGQVADIDGDGKLDLMVSSKGLFGVRAGRGDGTFDPPFYYSAVIDDHNTENPSVDLYGDGQKELLFTAFNKLQVWSRHPQLGTLFTNPIIVRGTSPSGLSIDTIRDINGDGFPDFILQIDDGTHCSNPLACVNSTHKEIWIGDGKGAFKFKPYNGEVSTNVGYNSEGDFNNDGLTDAVQAKEDNIVLQLGQPDGSRNLSAETYYVGTPAPDFLFFFNRLIAMDVNLDRRPDLIVVNRNGVSVLLNQWTPSKGDVNGDGKIDVEDAILLLQSILGLQPLTDDQRSLADVNADGLLDVSDVVLVLQVAVGLRPDFDDHPPQSDDFASGLAPFWKTAQPVGADPLPSPSAVAGGGTLALTSADRDVWQAVWEPFYAHQDGITGDFTMQAKVESIPDCGDVSAAGLMVAQSVPNSIPDPSRIPSWAAVMATRDYGTEAKWGGGGQSETSFPGTIDASLKPPYWVRLDRQGNTLSFFNSKDAKAWSAVGSPVDLAARGWGLNDPVSAEIVEQTHCEAALGTAVVSHFQAGPLSMAGKLPGDASP